MEAFQFQQSKKKMANEDNLAGEQKNYCLVLNSNDRVAGNHNTAEFNISFEFLPHTYDYYQMDYAFVTTAGVYRDTYAEFGGVSAGTPNNIFSPQIFDNTTPANPVIAPGAKFTTTDTSITLPSNLAVSNFRTATGTGGQYQMNQTFPVISTNTFTGTMSSGTNTITSVSGGTPVVGRFLNVAGALATGARVLYQDPTTPTTWYVSKVATGTITAGSFTQYIPITARLNNTVANLSVDFGCKKFIYDTDTKGQSGFMGTIPRFTGSSLSGTNYYRSWWNEQPSQIINMNNFSGTIRTRITTLDEFLLVDSTATGLPLGDMTPWQLFLSFTPIPSSAIETQCY
jgi:hypothetical protein